MNESHYSCSKLYECSCNELGLCESTYQPIHKTIWAQHNIKKMSWFQMIGTDSLQAICRFIFVCSLARFCLSTYIFCGLITINQNLWKQRKRCIGQPIDWCWLGRLCGVDGGRQQTWKVSMMMMMAILMMILKWRHGHFSLLVVWLIWF